MNIRDALKVVCCNSETGVLWEKVLKGRNFELSFSEYSAPDSSIWVRVFIKTETTSYFLGKALMIENPYQEPEYVAEEEIDKFIKNEYLLENEEVNIK